MTDNYAYFVPRSGVYSHPGDLGNGPEYFSASKSLPEIGMDAMLAGPVPPRHQIHMQQNDTTSQGSWSATGSAAELHQLNSYPEQVMAEFAEDTTMFNAPAPRSESQSRSRSPKSMEGFYNGNAVAQQQLSDNGEDMQPNVNDDELQSKRKSQNRAAQRAFRERREKHVKELQEKLEQAEKYAKEVEWENARLKKELDWYQAEHKTLKDAADSVRQNSVAANNNEHPSKAVFPEFHNGHSENHLERPINGSSDDTMFLNPSQVWDRLNEHPRADVLDPEKLVKRIMGKAQCSGHGLIFNINDVDEAIAAELFARNE
ncbi:uncharacterized protein V1513DRAFT_94319 [Lipomyces chichibuensis]|uniref:uncharacterized protein n=1 Tax=Lipomyces chichibuensis TaxID=1546026 RepID=UPI003343357B